MESAECSMTQDDIIRQYFRVKVLKLPINVSIPLIRIDSRDIILDPNRAIDIVLRTLAARKYATPELQANPPARDALLVQDDE